jgi:hypothetical protein
MDEDELSKGNRYKERAKSLRGNAKKLIFGEYIEISIVNRTKRRGN